MKLFFLFISFLVSSSIAFSSRPYSIGCKSKIEIKKIERISEVTGNGATVFLWVNVFESSCKELIGNKSVMFYWDPVARFRHRLEKLKQSNKEISELGVFEEGRKLDVVMDSYDHVLSEINGLKLPSP
ncbi:MAG: hypothetical protein M9962_00730 [Oligoflexia bacterium]|nr:hypothetical protein [Oligoflexia bacterium]